jgi:hypothetical protein
LDQKAKESRARCLKKYKAGSKKRSKCLSRSRKRYAKKIANGKKCEFGVTVEGKCAKKPGPKVRKPRKAKKPKSKSKSKKCKFGKKLDGGCKKKPGPKKVHA